MSGGPPSDLVVAVHVGSAEEVGQCVVDSRAVCCADGDVVYTRDAVCNDWGRRERDSNPRPPESKA